MGIKKLDSIWLDGQLVPWDGATDHLLAHTMHYGVGCFEGIRAYHQSSGKTAIFRLREHIDRLFDSATICTMDIPYTRDQVMAACAEVVRTNKMTACYLRPLVYLGYGALGLGSFEPPVRTMVACYEWGAYLGDDGLKKGIKCMISGYTRANSNAVMNKGKICGQYVTSVLAKRMSIRKAWSPRARARTSSSSSVARSARLRCPPRSSTASRVTRRSSSSASRTSRSAKTRSRATSCTPPTRCS
jgi:branched-chain amino acid aminotransferase